MHEVLPRSDFEPVEPAPDARDVLPRACAQGSLSGSIYELSARRSQLCLVNLGFTMEPSVPSMPAIDPPLPAGAERLRPLGVLRAAVDARGLEPWPFHRVLAERFPYLAHGLNVQYRALGSVSGVITKRRRLQPGLFFSRDFVSEAFHVARLVLYGMPEVWKPSTALEECGFSRRGDRTPLDQVLRVVRDAPLRVSIDDDRKLCSAGAMNVRVHTDGRLELSIGAYHRRDKAIARVRLSSPKREVRASDVMDAPCFVADYYFYWSALLGAAAEREQARSPSHEHARSDLRKRAAWYDLMSDLCARVAMGEIVKLAAVLGHEYLHFGSANHCRLRGRDLACCHYQVSLGIAAAARARLRLGYPLGVGRGREFRWGVEVRDQSVPSVLFSELFGGSATFDSSVGTYEIREAPGAPRGFRARLDPSATTRDYGPYLPAWQELEADQPIDDRYGGDYTMNCPRDGGDVADVLRLFWSSHGLLTRGTVAVDLSMNAACGGSTRRSFSVREARA